LTFRYEIRSARHLGELARTELPNGVVASSATASQHRDLYLDTPDDALRKRNIVCRLRLRSDDTRSLSLSIGGDVANPATRYDSEVRSIDIASVVAEKSEAARRLSALVNPALLVVRTELEVERLTRTSGSNWLGRPRIEIHYDSAVVRQNQSSAKLFQLCVHNLRASEPDVAALATAIEREHDLRRATEGTRDRAELLLRWKASPARAAVNGEEPAESHSRRKESRGEFLNPELSLLSFQSRVLAIAEDERTPLAERLKFLGIVSANVDEFFMIRMAGLRRAAREQYEEQCDDGLTYGEQLRLIRERVADITKRQSACAAKCLAALSMTGPRIVQWSELSRIEKNTLRDECREQIHPALTPMAMTLSPGHPLPHLPNLTLALAVVQRDPETRRLHLAELELPSDSPRFLRVPGREGAFIALEELVKSNIDLVYPGGV
jgi:hypothetical protein